MRNQVTPGERVFQITKLPVSVLVNRAYKEKFMTLKSRTEGLVGNDKLLKEIYVLFNCLLWI